MSEQIWKFPLGGGITAFADMPKDARPLSVGISGLEMVVWAIVDTREKIIERQFFHLAGTGNKLPHGISGCKFLNRVEVSRPSGLMIFHVWATGRWNTAEPDINEKVTLRG